MTRTGWLGLAVMLAACGGAPGDDDGDTASGESALANFDLRPTGRGMGLATRLEAAPARPKSTSPNGISYHGGPLILGGVNVYYIWYGSWASSTTPAILQDLAANIGGSPYFAINTTYSDGTGASVANAVAFGGATTDAYSHGTALTDTAIREIVSGAITSNRLPRDARGVYFVLTSRDVTATSGFCTSYCGWHAHGTISSLDVKYAFVGDPARCPSGCAEQWTSSPNGNPSADGMASIIAHELEEAATDPDLNAWYDRRGLENADKCAWTFGTTYPATNGSRANVRLGARDFLIQQNWVNANGGSCAMSYTPGLAATP